MNYDRRKDSGFSLIELIAAVAIVGILATVAYPSYSDYVTRSHRTDGMELLSEIMSQQQRYALRKRTFTNDLTKLGYASGTVTSKEGYYTVSAAICGVGIGLERCVNLTAAPMASGPQNGDGNLTLNSRGEKSWNSKDGWYHR